MAKEKKAKWKANKSKSSKSEIKSVTISPNHSKVVVTVKRFAEAPEDKRFVLADGRILKDIRELAEALEHMSSDVFTHHVNAEKNDFSSWVNGVLDEKELAEDLQKLDSQLHAQIAVLKHIAKKAF